MTMNSRVDPAGAGPEAAPADVEAALARLEQTSPARRLTTGGDPRPAFVAQLETQVREQSRVPSGAEPAQPRQERATARFPWLWRSGPTRLGLSRPLRLAGGLALVVLVLGLGLWLTRPAPVSAAAILARTTAGADVQSVHGLVALREREAADQPWNEGVGEIWFAAPDQLHEALTLHPAGGDAIQNVYVSDGTTAWSYDPPPDQVVIRDPDPELTTPFAATDLNKILQAAEHGQYTATLIGTELVVGRAAYVLDLTPVSGGSGPEARLRLWVDQQAYVPLREESRDAQGELLLSFAWTSIEVNGTIAPDTFTYVLPPGVPVKDSRVPFATEVQLQKWQAAAQQAAYPVFRPGAIPGQHEVADVVYDAASRQVVTHIALQVSSGDTTTLSTLTIQEAPEAVLAPPGAGEAVKVSGLPGLYNVGDLPGLYGVQNGQAILSTIRDGTRIILRIPDSPAARGRLIKTAQTMQVVPTK